MSTNPTQGPPHPGPAQQAGDAHDYREVLHDLITMGTSLARLLHDQATAQAQLQAQATQAQPAQRGARPQPAPAPAPITTLAGAPAPNAPVPETLATLAAAFDSTARGVRRGILLARSLDQPAPPAHYPAAHRTTARRRILREVEDTIQRPDRDDRGGPALPDSEQDSLRAELRDRLDGPDLDDDITGRPVADIITEICRDLGLDANPGTRPWQRRTPDDIRQLCARAAAPSAARQPGPALGPTPAPKPGTPPTRPRPRPARASLSQPRRHPPTQCPAPPALPTARPAACRTTRPKPSP